MIINESKTKDIVFRGPSPKRLHMLPSVDSIELVDNVMLFGVILQNDRVIAIMQLPRACDPPHTSSTDAGPSTDACMQPDSF